MRHDAIDDVLQRFLPPKSYAEQWDIEGLDERLVDLLGLSLPLAEWAKEEGIAPDDIEARVIAAADARAAEREQLIGSEQHRGIEKHFMLQMIDLHWREHMMHLDHLKNVIGLRGYGQRDPAERVQDRGLLAVREAAGRPAPGRDSLADDRRVPLRGAAAAGAAGPR